MKIKQPRGKSAGRQSATILITKGKGWRAQCTSDRKFSDSDNSFSAASAFAETWTSIDESVALF